MKNGFGTDGYCRTCRRPSDYIGKPFKRRRKVASRYGWGKVSEGLVEMRRVKCGHSVVVRVLQGVA